MREYINVKFVPSRTKKKQENKTRQKISHSRASNRITNIILFMRSERKIKIKYERFFGYDFISRYFNSQVHNMNYWVDSSVKNDFATIACSRGISIMQSVRCCYAYLFFLLFFARLLVCWCVIIIIILYRKICKRRCTASDEHTQRIAYNKKYSLSSFSHHLWWMPMPDHTSLLISSYFQILILNKWKAIFPAELIFLFIFAIEKMAYSSLQESHN